MQTKVRKVDSGAKDSFSQVGLRRQKHSSTQLVPFTVFQPCLCDILAFKSMIASHKPHLVLGTFTQVSFFKVCEVLSQLRDAACALFAIFSYGLFLLMGMEWGKVLVEGTQINLLCLDGCMGTDI